MSWLLDMLQDALFVGMKESRLKTHITFSFSFSLRQTVNTFHVNLIVHRRQTLSFSVLVNLPQKFGDRTAVKPIDDSVYRLCDYTLMQCITVELKSGCTNCKATLIDAEQRERTSFNRYAIAQSINVLDDQKGILQPTNFRLWCGRQNKAWAEASTLSPAGVAHMPYKGKGPAIAPYFNGYGHMGSVFWYLLSAKILSIKSHGLYSDCRISFRICMPIP